MKEEFMQRLEAELSEALTMGDLCPCCRQQWTADPGERSMTQIHDDDCSLMELRRMVGTA